MLSPPRSPLALLQKGEIKLKVSLFSSAALRQYKDLGESSLWLLAKRPLEHSLTLAAISGAISIDICNERQLQAVVYEIVCQNQDDERNFPCWEHC